MMDREETIKSIAKTIHRVEFPNSACWYGCDKCSYNGNCDYLKAAEIIYQQYIERTEIDTARKIFDEIEQNIGKRLHIDDHMRTYTRDSSVSYRMLAELKKKYKVEKTK